MRNFIKREQNKDTCPKVLKDVIKIGDKKGFSYWEKI